MPQRRWPIVAGALLALVVGVRSVVPRRAEAARPPALELHGHVEAIGFDARQGRLRCRPVRLEADPREFWAELPEDGSFRLTGLADTDYRLEVVAHSDPDLVLGRFDFARPGDDVRVLALAMQELAPPATGVTNSTE